MTFIEREAEALSNLYDEVAFLYTRGILKHKQLGRLESIFKETRSVVERQYNYNSSAANLVADKDGFVIGVVTGHNYHGVGEVIVQFFDGSADSALFNELNFPNGKEAALAWLNEREL